GEREHVGLELELLEPLLVLHAEAMLLVDDDEPEIGEVDVGTEQPMRADDDVDLLLGELAERLRLLLLSLEAAHDGDANREVGEPLLEGACVLVGENRRGHEHGDLTAALHRLEGGAHRDLRLSVADVADEEAVHGPCALHVGLHFGRRATLIGRVLEEEAALELALPRCVRHGRRTRGDFAPRVEVEQLDRHLLDGRAGAIALLRPPLAAKLVQPRRRRVVGDVVGRAVALELIDPVQGYVEAIASLVLDDGDLDRALPDEDRLDAAVDADAVLEMDDEVAWLEGERVDAAADVATRAPDAPLAPEDLVVGEDAE